MPLAVAAAALVAGCSTVDRIETTDLRPEAGGYTYTVKAGVNVPEGDPAAEAERMEWLATWMRQNGYCPAGYRVTDRTVMILYRALLGDVHRITYRVLCR